MARTHLFLAPQKGPFGEAALGIRIAKALCEGGDRVVFWAPAALAVLAEGTKVTHVPRPADDKTPIDEAILRVVRAQRPDSVVLLDIASVYLLLKGFRRDQGFAARFDVPLLGLDVWNLAETGYTWDMCGAAMLHSRHSADVKKRLIPVPFARLGDQKGLYNALPSMPAVTDDERADLREDFGIEPDEKMVLLTSAEWQSPKYQPHPNGQRLAAIFPNYVAVLLDRLDRRVKLLHVGPEPYPVSDRLGARYTWLAQRSPARFAKLLAAADLYLTFNFSGTTIHAAMAAGVPTLLGTNSYQGTAKDVYAKLQKPSDAVRSWLAALGVLSHFRVYPLGLYDTLAPTARNNPYTGAFRTVEVLDEQAFTQACHALVFDETARVAARAQQEAYMGMVKKLPSGAELLLSLLDG